MIEQEREFSRHSRSLLVIYRLAITVLLVSAIPILGAGPQTKSETLGRLDYVDHINREDLYGVTSVETSPDGRYAYAAAYPAGDLSVFKRDSESGYLEHIQTISGTDNMRGTVCARVSPCNRYVLCTCIYTGTVRLFERNQSNGTITLVDEVKNGENDVQNLEWPVDAAFSMDSRFVYVISPNSKAVTAFHITGDKKLAFVDCAKGENDCFDGARGIAISPNDKYIYVTSCKANTLVVLERYPETGKTKLVQVVKDEQGGVHGLAGVFSVACSPDSKFVYTSSGRFDGDSTICAFRRMPDGMLSLIQEIFDGQEGLVGFVGGNEVRISPDGQSLYAVGSRSNSVVVFRRDAENGKLTYLQTMHDSNFAGKNGSASGVGISPDGEYVYIAGEYDNSVLMFKRLTGTKNEPSENLHRAAFLGDIAQMKSLIEGGIDLNKSAERGYAPLHWAIKAGQRDAAELLIAKGADINIRTGSGGWSPLHIAIMQDDKDMIAWLISKGANINLANQNNDLTPLLFAVTVAKHGLVKLLINEGANINTQDKELKTPLHYVSMYGNKRVAKLLIEKGADVNGTTKDGSTPLLYATRAGNKDMIELLISSGAQVNAEDASGMTALSFAVMQGNKDRAEFLVSKGADVNMGSVNSQSLLHVSILRGQRDMAELLIGKGADVNVKNRWGRTPLRIAVGRGQTEIAELLRKHGAKE